eukprot:TRINITY_DN96_c0_g1_i2.p1 TRINITY_DN96_c0_g1~~TRINITY_DN96_c0_g1_i2.p1  ORF type:complete len:308 (+),score=69.76 TRINITY_DN96_c0_g1_i2:28-924(+)
MCIRDSSTIDEIMARYNIFAENYRYIEEHNSKNDDFKLAVNQFADLTLEKFKELHLAKRGEADGKIVPCQFKHVKATPNPEIDWKKKGVVTPVRNQGNCASCYAFSAIGALEGLFTIKKGKIMEFSEQELVDCSRSYGNKGCLEGEISLAFEYIKDKGISTRREYRYEGADGTCRKKSNSFQISGCANITKNDNDMMLEALSYGPVSAWIRSDNREFIYYHSGVIKGNCGTDQDELDHGITIVGAGYESGSRTPFWLIKNSWGSHWGEEGYVRLKRDTGRSSGVCGIALESCYPILKS